MIKISGAKNNYLSLFIGELKEVLADPLTDLLDTFTLPVLLECFNPLELMAVQYNACC